MLENIEFILLIFVMFYFLILGYDFFSLIIERLYSKINNKKINQLVNILKEKDKKKYFKYLKKISNLNILEELLEKKYKINNEYIKDIINLEEYNNTYNKLCNVYAKKDNIERAYFAYMLSYIECNSEIIDSFLLKTISHKSIYCIENSLYTIYKKADINLIKRAYDNLCKSEVEYSSKLITDGLLNYEGNINEICDMTYKNIKKYNDILQIGLINYYKNVKYDIKEKIYKELKSSKKINKELEISYIRYFSKVKYNDAYKLFLDRLNDDYYSDFEYDVVMIQTLYNYNTKSTINTLIKELSSENYYIRLNSGKVLKKLTDISKIKVEDKFATEMLKTLQEMEL